jgi:hypothetical protein
MYPDSTELRVRQGFQQSRRGSLHREWQDAGRRAAGESRQDNNLVFASKVGTELDAHNVRRSFRVGIQKDYGLNPGPIVE